MSSSTLYSALPAIPLFCSSCSTRKKVYVINFHPPYFPQQLIKFNTVVFFTERNNNISFPRVFRIPNKFSFQQFLIGSNNTFKGRDTAMHFYAITLNYYYTILLLFALDCLVNWREFIAMNLRNDRNYIHHFINSKRKRIYHSNVFLLVMIMFPQKGLQLNWCKS